MTDQILADLKILDLSWVVAGPLIGRALADFGATVVRVESARRVETARLMPPFYGGVNDPEHSALYGTCNAGKLGVSLDLGTADGRAVARDLASWSDVVVESFSRGRMARWGLDYETLRRDHPGLIMVSTTIMGQSGPYADLAGFGNIGAALSGFQHLAGWPDRLPLGPFGPYTDYVAPRLALVALLGALAQRDRTGQGCHLDISQVEAGMMFLSPQLAQYDAEGTVAQRQGNRDDAYAPHGVYPCRPDQGRDRFVAIAVCDDAQWQRLADLLAAPGPGADPGLAADPDLATAAGRQARADELDDRIAGWTGHRSADEVERRLQDAGIPAHTAAASQDYAVDPQLRHRGHLVTLPHPQHGEVVVEGPRYQLSQTPGAPGRAAPTVGQDNEHVLRDLLGYSQQRYEELQSTGVLT